MTFSVDDKSIKDTLISRINSSSQVSVVTLSLFETILSFNLEDVMFGLIFQYLISCTYLLSSHRDKICYADPQGRAAFKFLSLVPVSCDPPETPVTPRRNPFSAASHPSPSRPLPPPGSEEPGCLDPSLGDPTSYPGAVYVGTSNYQQYIRTCRQIIRSTACDCLQWKNRYDGSDEFRRSIKTRATRQQSLGMKIERAGFILDSDLVHDNVQIIDNATGSGSLSGESSGYLSGNWELEAEEVTLSPEEETEFWSAVGGSEITKERLKTVLARIQHEDRLSLSSLCSDELSPRPSLPLEDRPHLNDILHPSPSSSPSLGPFLTSLLTSVQNFEQNKLAFNLRVTAIISKLAAFPQPLLRCILTHPDIIVQPSCTTLIQAICTARSRLDSVMPGLLGAEEAVRQARQFLQDRLSPGKSMSTASITSLPASFGEYSRRGSKLLNMLGRRSNPLSLSNQRTQPVIPPHTHRMAMAAVLLEEWLQELAAIVQEHAIMEQQAAIMR
ncbi:FTS and Hook-interacting protein homolog isoform X2 [Eurytemora carolleeae]|uniref:FTS and Hook-interacting protein homolog isoform X2 n=1 Tax=Eurytemora carolleeae TaxID=1294199 RepID=UPI000C768BAC|nr:FTS and Hook-interacting protein homolog isoform X2 [Eurytemora carolleeae]|eukprot:XP_023342379.1 FTS and Hook-interacting protein homolog isoform X2 [Eurytemora affinis]